MATRLISIPPETVPRFDELYAISDLHLGGLPGFQIFDAGAELVRLVEHLRSRAAERQVALVINGDLVDFLAERPATYFDPDGAVQKLDRIATREAFEGVFKALRKFAGTKNCSLAITLGNHDLELALPWVREHLLGLLSRGNEAARGRITLAFDGAGFRCRVGEATVLCVHGNEVDLWNVADHERIRRIGQDAQRGRAVAPWIPNAGTQLVIDAMNEIKSRFPFVDLLKPEAQAVVPTLLALAPDQRDRIAALTATVRRLTWDRVRRATGFLGDEQEDGVVGATTASAFPARTAPSTGVTEMVLPERDRRSYADALLEQTEKRLAAEVEPLALIANDARGEYLGIGAAVGRMVRGQSRPEVLREALQELKKDRSFDPTTEDQTFRDLDQEVGAGVDFLLTGHTHLERALPRKQARGHYFNSGTWVRLIRLEDKLLDSSGEFAKAYEAFEKGTMQALDEFPGLVVRRRGMVAIRSDESGTHGQLLNVSVGADRQVLLEDRSPRFMAR